MHLAFTIEIIIIMKIKVIVIMMMIIIMIWTDIILGRRVVKAGS